MISRVLRESEGKPAQHKCPIWTEGNPEKLEITTNREQTFYVSLPAVKIYGRVKIFVEGTMNYTDLAHIKVVPPHPALKFSRGKSTF
jgi:hypothetical protein